MGLTPAEVADRAELGALVAAYSHAVDGQQWDLLDQVFTADSHFDFLAVSDFSGGLEAFKDWLANTLRPGRRYCHLMGLSHIVVTPDGATAETPCLNPSEYGQGRVSLGQHWYQDTFVRTDEGWRIRSRRLEFGWRLTLTNENLDPFTMSRRRS